MNEREKLARKMRKKYNKRKQRYESDTVSRERDEKQIK